MFDKKSREEVLKHWLRAVEEFSSSTTPCVGSFASLTGQVVMHGNLRDDSLSVATHVIEEIAGAKAITNPNKVDSVMLRSQTITSYILGTSERILEECWLAGSLASRDEAKQRLQAVSEAIQRRRHAIGRKGRGFYFD